MNLKGGRNYRKAQYIMQNKEVVNVRGGGGRLGKNEKKRRREKMKKWEGQM